MRAILDIALNDLRVVFRERGIWLNLIVIPIALSYLVGFANGEGARNQPIPPDVVVDAIDQDGSALSAAFLDAIRAANTSIRICPADNGESDVCRLDGATLDDALAEQRLKDQVSLALLVIPAGFGTEIDAGNPVNVAYRSSEDAFAPTFIREAVNAAVQTVGGAAAAATVGVSIVDETQILTFSDDSEREAFRETVRTNAAEQWATNPITIDYQLTTFDANRQVANSGGGFGQSVPGMATMYVMFTIFPLASAFILERKQWTMQRLVTMPVTRAQILGGKLLARFALGMLQYAIMFTFGYFVGVRYGSDPIALLLLMILFVLCISALTLALTTLLKSSAQAEGITLFLSLVMAPLGGAWWPIEITPQFMQTAARLTPVAWVMDGYRSLIFEGGNLMTVAPALAVLAVMTVIFFAFGVARFRIE